MNYTALALAITIPLIPAFVVLAVYLIAQTHHTQELIMSFRTDADAAITSVQSAIAAIAARVPTATDPATIVPVADQTAILGDIAALKIQADSIDPTPTSGGGGGGGGGTPPPPTPVP